MDGKLKGSPAESQQVGVESSLIKEPPPVTQPPPDSPLPPPRPTPEPPPANQDVRSSPLGSVGSLLIVFAALLVLHTLDLLPNPFVFAPLLLVYVGIRGVRHTEGPSRVLSIGFLTVGVIMQIGMFSNMDASEFGLLAPVISISGSLDGVANLFEHTFTILLVVGGIYRIRRHHLRGVQRAAADADASGTGPVLASDLINQIAIFSGSSRQPVTDTFRGGRVTTLFGGAELDLRDCRMQVPEARLHIACVFGGVEVRVPEHWDVIVEAVPIFGGIDVHGVGKAQKRRIAQGDRAEGRLVLTGAAIFGGIDVKVS